MAKLHCSNCGEEYYCRPSQVKDSKYCSRECQYESWRTGEYINCPVCNEKFYAQRKRINKSKSGYLFCSRECKDRASRLGGIEEIHPEHYGSPNQYRRRAFENFENKCKRCGYDEFDTCLEAHHIDGDHDNNSLDNLMILCANCHRAVENNLCDPC